MTKYSYFDRLARAREDIKQKRILLRKLTGVMHVQPHQIVIVVAFSVLVAALDAVGLGLLVPLAEGVVAGDFTATDLPIGLDQIVTSSLKALEVAPTAAVMFAAIAAVIFVVNLLGIVTGFLNVVYGQYLQGKYQYHLNTFVYSRYFSFGKAYFDRTSQGTIKKVLEYTNQIVRVIRALQVNLGNFTRLLAYMVVMFWLSWQLMLLVLLVGPLLYIISRFVMRRVNALWTQAKDITLALGQESFNMLSALPLVWSYSREKQAKKKYGAMNENFRKVQLRAQMFGAFTVTIPTLMTLVTMLVVVSYITWTMQRGGAIDLTHMVIFLYVASRTVPLFKVFNTAWVVISEITPPIQEVLRLFGDKKKYMVAGGSVQFAGLQEHIEFRDLTYAYEGRSEILQRVSFRIPKGQLTALVGPSGGGKSTIISLLMRFYDCPPGTVFVDGADIRTFTLASLRHQMATVDQEPILLHDSLRNNITYGHEEVTPELVHDVAVKTHLDELIKRLPQGLDTLIGDRGVQLSGGEKQRVAIARAMLKGSEILLLDEATSALDSKTEQIVQEALAEAIQGRTALVIAHRLSTIRGADNIIYVDDGKVVEQGTMTELIDKGGAFARQWEAQAANA